MEIECWSPAGVDMIFVITFSDKRFFLFLKINAFDKISTRPPVAEVALNINTEENGFGGLIIYTLKRKVEKASDE